jgi:pimeloyl-ACP methyl ester carboxylesterase
MPAEAAEYAFELFCTPTRRSPVSSPRATGIMEIADKSTVQVDSNVIQVYQWSLDVQGPTRNRPKVFLLHGWGATTKTLHNMVEQLLFIGCDVVSFDFPAHGNSTGRQTTLSDCLRALQVISKKFGPATALVGHGYGGSIAALSAVPSSHLATISGVQRLVLIGAPDEFSQVLDRFGERLGIYGNALRRLKARAGVSLGGPVECFTTSSAVWGAELPTLVIHDKNDPEIPHDDGKAIASAIENGIFISTENENRKQMIESGRVAHEAARFIQSGLHQNTAPPKQKLSLVSKGNRIALQM